MGNIKEFGKFINEEQDADKTAPKIKKLCKLHISEKFKKVLENIAKAGDSLARPIAKDILDIVDSDKTFNLSYLDLGLENDKFTFLQSPRAWRMLNIESEEQSFDKPAETNEVWNHPTQRQPLGIGSLPAKLFADKYSQLAVSNFVNSYKAEYDAINIFHRFKVVEGENVRFWYNERNYAGSAGSSGGATLLSSCMRYDAAQRFLDIYVANPEKCGLVILTNPDNKLIGRALLWKNLRKPKGATFMDRIYSIRQSDEELFKKFAIENGWIYKHTQSSSDNSYMEGDKRVYDSLSTQLTPYPQRHNKYPYADTMKYFTPDTGRLASDAGYAARKCSADGTFIRPLTQEQKDAGEVEVCSKCGGKSFVPVQRLRMESTGGEAQNV